MDKTMQHPLTNPHRRIGVMIVDDRDAVRTGLATFLEAFDDLCLVAQAGSAGEALRLCQELRPDVVLVDVGMAAPQGIETIRAIRQEDPTIQVIALSGYQDQDRQAEALCAGAIECLRKDAHIDALAAAIRNAGRA